MLYPSALHNAKYDKIENVTNLQLLAPSSKQSLNKKLWSKIGILSKRKFELEKTFINSQCLRQTQCRAD